MRKINEAGLYLLKHWESFSPVIYLCQARVPSIGYGETDKKIISKYKNSKMTEAEASDLLAVSIVKYERAVIELINVQVPLYDNEFAALVSFTYNTGINSLKNSTLRKILLKEDYEGVPKQLSRWIYAGGKRSNGLINRRNAEIKLWESYDE